MTLRCLMLGAFGARDQGLSCAQIVRCKQQGCGLILLGLAAMVVYLTMLDLAKNDEVPDHLWKADGIVAVFNSLHEIGTSCEIVGNGTHAESLAAVAARQNQDAKATPLNSKEWASLALSESPP